MHPFLTAEWRDLVLLNYEVPAELLTGLVPAGTTLDHHDGRILASVVGFCFQDTRLLGWAVPFHRNFDEVNLRFYVRRQHGTAEPRRGVVFVREFVPRRAIAWVARLAYNEPYRRVPMHHRIDRDDQARHPSAVAYHWRSGGADYSLGGLVAGPPAPLERPSEAEFITEHYWGYTRQRDGGTIEYQVTHPAWTVARLRDARLSGDIASLYGAEWAHVLGGSPCSAFYAAGSAVAVFQGHRL